ncbi:MAG: hypothetical protein P0116_13315 [Candidatus Nitrosocosmicus sp.]|nr:hypothetical protein [Candidatus Nitrosocosmicus sp.]
MSDFTDAVDEKRRKGIHYKTALESFKVELKDFEGSKKERIINLANILKESRYDEEKISEKVGNDLTGYLSKQYVRKVLGDEFKQKKFQSINSEGATSSATNTEEKKQSILVTTNGNETVDQESESSLDQIYGGKSFTHMRREAQREVKGEEEPMESPKNRFPLLSDIPSEIREKLARSDEMEEMVRQIAEDRDAAIKKEAWMAKLYNQHRYGAKDQELQRYKIEVNNLKALLSDVDKESLVKEGSEYKEIEVLKMDSGTTRLLNEISNKSQKTFFLLVHPKTMQIKGAKTDVQMHIVQVKREAGIKD